MHFFNEDAMKHYKYHWLWGLSYTPEIDSPNMWDEMLKLENEEQFEDCKQKLDRIQHYPGFIRWVYWLFNIEEYTRQYYVFKLHVLYNFANNWSGNTMLDEELSDDDSIPERGNPVSAWFWGSSLEIEEDEFEGGPDFRMVDPKLDFYSRWIEPTEQRFASIRREVMYVVNFLHRRFWATPEPREEDVSQDTMDFSCDMPTDSGEKKIIVKWYMAEDLRCLGLEKKANEWLSWSELKKAHRHKALAYHPDKQAEGSVVDTNLFSNMQTSYQWLCKVFDQEDDIEMRYMDRRAKQTKENEAKRLAEMKAKVRAELKVQLKAEIKAEIEEELAELRASLQQFKQEQASSSFFSTSEQLRGDKLHDSHTSDDSSDEEYSGPSR